MSGEGIQRVRLDVLRGFLDAVLEGQLHPLTRKAVANLASAIDREYLGVVMGVCGREGAT